MINDPLVDWPESFQKMENGNYLNICVSCKKEYIGPKRSYVCWPCKERGEKEWNALTEEQKSARMVEIGKIIQENFKKTI